MDDAAAVSPINGDDSRPSLPRKFNNPVLPPSSSPLYILNELEVFGHQFVEELELGEDHLMLKSLSAS